jgi:hypothetical protein
LTLSVSGFTESNVRFSIEGFVELPFPKVRYPGQFHFRMSIFTFMAGIPRKVPPPESAGFAVLAESIVPFESAKNPPLIVSTEAASVFIVLRPFEGAGIMDERWVTRAEG